MRLPTPLRGGGMVMTLYGNVCVGRSEPDPKDVIPQKIKEDRLKHYRANINLLIKTQVKYTDIITANLEEQIGMESG